MTAKKDENKAPEVKDAPEETKPSGSFKVTEGNSLNHNMKMYEAGDTVPIKDMTKKQAEALEASGMISKG